MNKWLLMMLASLLVGCSSEPQSKSHFYLIPNNPALSEVNRNKNLPLLIVQPVELAAYLDTQGIVYRKSDTQVIQARQNLWAQRLSSQLTQRLINDLRANSSHYWPVTLNTAAAQQKHWKLQVRFQQFNGAYTGNAEIAGNWELSNAQGERLLNQEFAFQVPLTEEGYPALVEALSSGLNNLSTQIQEALVKHKTN
ncbi:membrane integrity-associated transporter subunit PqiC [Vibrio mimicus]